jgi:hypothetical protein
MPADVSCVQQSRLISCCAPSNDQYFSPFVIVGDCDPAVASGISGTGMAAAISRSDNRDLLDLGADTFSTGAMAWHIDLRDRNLPGGCRVGPLSPLRLWRRSPQ